MQDQTSLFAQYLEVVNDALRGNRDAFPYNRLIDVGQRLFDDKKIGVEIYSTDPNAPQDYFTIDFKGGTFNLLEHGKAEPDTTWKLPVSHMREVVDDPEPFIEKPFELDLDWLKRRIRLDA